MTDERWEQAQQIFHEAVELPETQRDPFITNRCSGDAPLEALVRGMIRNDPGPDSSPPNSIDKLLAEELSVDPGESLVGTEVRGFRILGVLGKGGGGRVFLAEQMLLGRKVVIKALLDHRLLDRFNREAQIPASFHHPNIPTVIDRFDEGRFHFIVTEFVDGTNLRSRLEQGPLALNEALEIAEQVASALAYVHSERIVHRDVKPENIMIRPGGKVSLVDFGIAR